VGTFIETQCTFGVKITQAILMDNIYICDFVFIVVFSLYNPPERLTYLLTV